MSNNSKEKGKAREGSERKGRGRKVGGGLEGNAGRYGSDVPTLFIFTN